jgi:hypothetical protein
LLLLAVAAAVAAALEGQQGLGVGLAVILNQI